MLKNNNTIDLEYDPMYNKPYKNNIIYSNSFNKVLENQKSVSAVKNRDKLIYSLSNKYPHNNYKKKYFLKNNKTEKYIYDSNIDNNKCLKENDRINLSTINKNGKIKLIQYFGKKFINSSYNKQIRNGQYITNQLDLSNLNKEKKRYNFYSK